MHLKIISLILLPLLLFAAACNEEIDHPESPTPEMPDPTPPSVFAIGEMIETVHENRLTVHTVEFDVMDQYITPEPGNIYIAFDVEGCANSTEAATLNPNYFRVQMPDSSRINSYIGIREPALNHTELVPGDCVRGWVTFEVPEAQRPTSINFETYDMEFRPIVLKWELGP